jgi:hypothetical protein
MGKSAGSGRQDQRILLRQPAYGISAAMPSATPIDGVCGALVLLP